MVSLHAFVLAAALAGSSDLVLLDFSADWCAPCRSMEPTIQRLQEAGYPVRRVNVDQSPDLARHFCRRPDSLLRAGQGWPRSAARGRGHQLRPTGPDVPPGGPRPTAAPGEPASAGNPRSHRSSRRQHRALPNLTLVPTQSTNVTSAGQSGSQTDALPVPIRLRRVGQLQPPRCRTPSIKPISWLCRQRYALRVIDATGQSHGTGTIIDFHGDEALVLTCGHIFRESQGQRGDSTSSCLPPARKARCPVICCRTSAENRDFGLVSIRPDVPVTPVRVAPTHYHPRTGEPIFSVGCDHGADPTVRVSTISAVDRYSGPPNIEIYGHPVEGRSGGGLFTADGRIIGICNAADLQEDRGIFAALPTIHLAWIVSGSARSTSTSRRLCSAITTGHHQRLQRWRAQASRPRCPPSLPSHATH